MGHFQYVSSGDPLVISADEYNAMLDAGKLARNRPVHHGVHGNGFDSLYIYVANETGRRLRRFGVVGLESALHPRDVKAFCHRVAFRGVVPVRAKHSGKFAILQADSEPGQLVRACVSGVSIARIHVDEKSVGKEIFTCDVMDGETGCLTQGGHQEVLWSDTHDRRRWGLVRLGRLQRIFRGKLAEDVRAKTEKIKVIADEDEREVEVTVPYPEQTRAYSKNHPCRYYAGGSAWMLLDYAPGETLIQGGKLAAECGEGASSVSITPDEGDRETITATVPYPSDLKKCGAGHRCRYYSVGDKWMLLDLACPPKKG